MLFEKHEIKTTEDIDAIGHELETAWSSKIKSDDPNDETYKDRKQNALRDFVCELAGFRGGYQAFLKANGAHSLKHLLHRPTESTSNFSFMCNANTEPLADFDKAVSALNAIETHRSHQDSMQYRCYRFTGINTIEDVYELMATLPNADLMMTTLRPCRLVNNSLEPRQHHKTPPKDWFEATLEPKVSFLTREPFQWVDLQEQMNNQNLPYKLSLYRLIDEGYLIEVILNNLSDVDGMYKAMLHIGGDELMRQTLRPCPARVNHFEPRRDTTTTPSDWYN